MYQNAIDATMRLFEITKSFPMEEKFSMTDQIRRSSRSVCANIAEAWRKRRYKAAFIAKLSDAESEASETQVWVDLANKRQYLDRDTAETIDKSYDLIISQLVCMIEDADKWLIKK